MDAPEIPELLAPAGSPDALIAAVAAGADAVYLGGTLYGARRMAVNFGTPEMEWAVRYCHLRGVRVYVTLNILLTDPELEGAVAYARWLYAQGVDAVIVQDVGFASLLHAGVPGLALHASTQMTVLSQAGIRWAGALGCSRVVLPRELTLDEIAAVYAESDGSYPAPEVFVHGALCYAYSGQCLLSSLIGGRSGNRGSCAQPCRREYTLLCGDADTWGNPVERTLTPVATKYLLSPKDLCVYPEIPAIVRSPAVSLKIEGRMKSPEYVATVVSLYRRALDAAASGDFVPADADMLALYAAFNREFTGGYLMDKKSGTVMGADAPGNRGVRIGTVSAFNPRKKLAEITLEGTYTPADGDGLSFGTAMDGAGFYGGTVLLRTPEIENRRCRVRVPMRVHTGDAVFLTKSGTEARNAAALMKTGGSGMVPLALSLTMDGLVPVLEGTALLRTGAVSLTYRGGFAFSEAKNRPLETEILTDLLSRMGDTPFSVDSFTSAYPGGLFAPIGEITRFRREFVAALEAAVFESFLPPEAETAASGNLSLPACAPQSEPRPVPPAAGNDIEIAAYAADCDTVRGALAGGCTRIYFEPCGDPGAHRGWGDAETEAWYASAIGEAIDLCAASGADLIWKWPRITRQGFLQMACRLLSSLSASGLRGVMVETVGALAAVRETDRAVPVWGGSGLNIFNSRSAAIFGRDCASVTLSPELSFSSIRGLVSALRAAGDADTAVECIIHGPAELAVSEDCVLATATGRCPGCRGLRGTGQWFGLKDAKGHLFPVTVDDACRTHIWNSRETCIIDHLDALVNTGIRSVAIDCRIHTGEYAQTVVRAYRFAFDLVSEGTNRKGEDMQALKAELQRMAPGGITSGHFLKGVTEKEQKLF